MDRLTQSSADSRDRRQLVYVDAALPYLRKAEAPPYRYIGDPPPGVPRERGELDHRHVRIWGGWELAHGFSLSTNGFVVALQPTPFGEFRNPEAIRQCYLPEMQELALAATGATRALAFDFNVRHAPSVESPNPFLGKPARLVHNDYTPASASKRVLELMGPDAGRRVLEGRYTFINIWRPISEPLRDAPLAICDARSIEPNDLVVSTLIYPERRGEVYRLVYNQAHRWFFFPDMQRNEVLIFKSFASYQTVGTPFAPHSAFDDPSCPPGSPPRQSIEVRILCWWS